MRHRFFSKSTSAVRLTCDMFPKLSYFCQQITLVPPVSPLVFVLSHEETRPRGKHRHDGLLKMQKQIEEERRGAYAKFFQDPALAAMLLPSGIFGILTVLFRALFTWWIKNNKNNLLWPGGLWGGKMTVHFIRRQGNAALGVGILQDFLRDKFVNRR